MDRPRRNTATIASPYADFDLSFGDDHHVDVNKDEVSGSEKEGIEHNPIVNWICLASPRTNSDDSL
jgi:hypothetical protein